MQGVQLREEWVDGGREKRLTVEQVPGREPEVAEAVDGQGQFSFVPVEAEIDVLASEDQLQP